MSVSLSQIALKMFNMIKANFLIKIIYWFANWGSNTNLYTRKNKKNGRLDNILKESGDLESEI